MNLYLMGIFSHSFPSCKRKAREIYENLNVSKFFVFNLKNVDVNDKKFLMTFNVIEEEYDKLNLFKEKFKIIQLHRKKEHNVLYTINALNEIIKSSGNPEIIWENYQNNLLITKQNLFQNLQLELFNIIDIS